MNNRVGVTANYSMFLTPSYRRRPGHVQARRAGGVGWSSFGVKRSAGSSRARILAEISRSCSICAADNELTTNSRTAATWPGADARMCCHPASVRWAFVARLSCGHGMRSTNPRFTSRVTTWESRGSVEFVCAARAVIRRVWSGASDSIARTMYSKWLTPASRCSWLSSAPGQQLDNADESQPSVPLCWREPPGFGGHGYSPALLVTSMRLSHGSSNPRTRPSSRWARP